MKILRIAGRNLASLAGEFCVDFESEPLASSGLFAISGPTGAGKSTLLDALCLALYAATPRLNRRSSSQLPDVGSDTISVLDQRTLLRRGTGEGWAEVDFIGTGQERYRARWSVRRTRNQPNGKLQPAKLSLHRLPELTPIGATNTEVSQEIVARIGLNFEQFTRAVLLAQNEFSAFLKTDDNERGELLETLTGTTIYSELSRRAFERHKAEQARSRELAAQLASAAPLTLEERSALQAQREQADQHVQTLQQRHAQLDTILRWHAEREQLQQSEQAARDAAGAAEQAWQAAQERRSRLATLDAAQGARPLVSELIRVQQALQQAQAARLASQSELAAHQAARLQAESAVDSSQAQVQQAEQALAAATGALDQAKALDAALALLNPRHLEARDLRDAAREQRDQASASMASHSAALEQAKTCHAAAQQWLTTNTRWEQIATDWPRWQRLLDQAAQTSRELGASNAHVNSASGLATQAKAQAQGASTAQAQLEQQVQQLELARASASAALQRFDPAAINASRAQLVARQQQLLQGEHRWRELGASRSAMAELDVELSQATQQLAQAQQRQQLGVQQTAPLAAALSQAERALTQAQQACAASVEQLRATLSSEHPCPVCGSMEHPYAHQDQVLRTLLDGLQAEVDRCRQQANDNAADTATAQAQVSAATSQLAQLERKHTQLREQLQQREAAWQASALAPQLQDTPDWFQQQQALLTAQAEAQQAQEQAWQQADGARAQAQHQLDQLQAALAQQRQQAGTAREQVVGADAALEAAQQRQTDTGERLSKLVQELDAAMAQAEGDGWQARWQADPDDWQARCARAASNWQAQREQLQQHDSAATTLGVQLASLQQRHTELVQAEQQAGATLARVEAELMQQRAKRQTLFGGRPVLEVEQQFGQAIQHARTQLASAEQHARQAQQLDIAWRSKQVQLADQITALEQAGHAASTALADWLHDYQPEQHQAEPIQDIKQLTELLQVGSAWLAQERSALQALDAGLGQQRAVAQDRQQRLQAHLAASPEEGDTGLDALRATHAALQSELGAATEAATALRVRLLQDDQRRTQAASALAAIDQQHDVERRWATLAELIGSADGKRFRNYAQQFTLDVLLGYANAHLSQLARRYRLERVSANSGPSLALLVRDQDMGGEIRSVNSLSGGESFLVSLALALGLASLSSNRVQVESLFIDEGFGSLDSETLGVAMDALDALQSQGRKVGVISHVQEMTERIATRVLVRPSGGGCSEVVVE